VASKRPICGTTQTLTAIDYTILQDVRLARILRDAARAQGRHPAPQPLSSPQAAPQAARIRAHKDMMRDLASDLMAISGRHPAHQAALARLARLTDSHGRMGGVA